MLEIQRVGNKRWGYIFPAVQCQSQRVKFKLWPWRVSHMSSIKKKKKHLRQSSVCKSPQVENYPRTWTDASVAGAQCSRGKMAQEEVSEEDRNLCARGSVCPWVTEQGNGRPGSNPKVKFHCTTVPSISDSQSVFHRSATSLSPGNLLEMLILRIHPSLTKSDTLGTGPSNLCFNKVRFSSWTCTTYVKIEDPSFPLSSHAHLFHCLSSVNPLNDPIIWW